MNGSRRVGGAAFLKWLVIIAIVGLGGWGFWMYANQQKLYSDLEAVQAENAQLQEEKQGLEQRLAQMAKPTEDPNSLELVKLRAEVARLRNLEREHKGLLTENQQLKATVQQLQQVNAETANLRNENAQLAGALQAKAFTEACIVTLKQIAVAKARWAAENQKKPTDVPTDVDIFGKYIPQKPACPAGGVYNLGPVHVKPTCTVPGHTY